MTNLTLTKHHGLGNDFLIAWDVGDSVAPALARRVCDRHRGIGADGLLVGSDASGHDARMVLFNADGSRAEMSGNGIRCFAQALAERRGHNGEQRILTDAGTRTVQLEVTADPEIIVATVAMGDVGTIAEPAGWEALGCNPDRPVLHVSLGNPHTVVGVDEVAVVDLTDLGNKVPQINLEIIEPGPEPDAVTMRVHERGVGITEACGTGACAAAFAARSWGLVSAGDSAVTVHMDGGTVSVRFDDATAELTGPAAYIGRIEVRS